MGVTAVAIVVVCAALYTVFELIERRKQRNFEEQLRQYIKEHKGDWTMPMKSCLNCGWDLPGGKL